MSVTKREPPRFDVATHDGTVTNRGGYHKPRAGYTSCSCDLTTRKGAYRDVTVELEDGRTVHYYHQNGVVVEFPDGTYRLFSYGYRTLTTKERMNRYLPSGYRVYQRDYEWYVETPDGDVLDYEDGMTLEP